MEHFILTPKRGGVEKKIFNEIGKKTIVNCLISFVSQKERNPLQKLIKANLPWKI